ncbi:hypothetical protein CR513_33492, partial [Mucuna pruriens]
MEDETSGKGSTLILGRPFLMIARTKIDVHAGTLSMEFRDTLSRSVNKASLLYSPPIELKSLPDHLKYTYLDNDQQFPIIITNNLHREQEEKLLQHKKVIGWRLSDLLGINPSICMHKILMEEETCPIRKQQRRLNPTILDVVKKEVMKLLTIRIIYPFLDS